jgi:hypothetical protein
MRKPISIMPNTTRIMLAIRYTDIDDSGCINGIRNILSFPKSKRITFHRPKGKMFIKDSN